MMSDSTRTLPASEARVNRCPVDEVRAAFVTSLGSAASACCPTDGPGGAIVRFALPAQPAITSTAHSSAHHEAERPIRGARDRVRDVVRVVARGAIVIASIVIVGVSRHGHRFGYLAARVGGPDHLGAAAPRRGGGCRAAGRQATLNRIVQSLRNANETFGADRRAR